MSDTSSSSEDERPQQHDKSQKSQSRQERLGRKAVPQNQGRKRKRDKKVDKEYQEKSLKYKRGERNTAKNVSDKKLQGSIKKSEKRNEQAVRAATRAEILQTEEAGYLEAEGMERTWRFKQDDIAKHVDINTARKKFDLKLDTFGPYELDYTRSGRHMLFAGRKGHIAMLDTLRNNVVTEFHVKETVRDVKFLHNETMFAVAQKKYVFIYDSNGLELHCLRKQLSTNRLEFLPYHFLLCSVGGTGFLRYQDTSTGKLVAEIKTKLGPCETMAQNSWNAVINLGHANGTVTMWTPNMSTPVVKMLCHRAPVQALAVDRGGNYMASAGLDGQLKIWDIRTYKEMHSYYCTTPASSLDISQLGLLGVGFGPNVQIWKDALKTKAKSPYLTHRLPGSMVQDVHFRPYDDIMAIGHNDGLSTIIVPGSGEPNFDTFEANPFQNKKQRREAEVVSLLEKLQPEMITLNPHIIGNVDAASADTKKQERKEEAAQRNEGKTPDPEKKKTRGRSKIGRKLRKKQQNIIDERRVLLQQKLEKEKEERRSKAEKERKETAAKSAPRALQRFYK